MAGPTADFWQEKFNKNEIAWDRGAASPQLLAWLDSGALQPCRILVPGCGSGWEVAELARRGFEVVGLDYTEAAVALARHGRNVGFAYNRKEAKDHGEGGTLVGAPMRGRVAIIDDVISAGTSVRESVDIIRKEGAQPSAVLIALDRRERGGQDAVA